MRSKTESLVRSWATLPVRIMPQVHAAEAGRTLLETLLALAAATPLVLAGMRKDSQPRRLRLLGASAFVILATTLATCLPAILGIGQPGGLYWNWVGKLACVMVVAVLVGLLPEELRRRSGIFRLPSRSAVLPVLVVAVFCALLGLAAGPGEHVGAESLAFQAIMPSLAEEPVYRAILPALLGAALDSPWKLGGARLGWWWLVCALLFGAGHGIVWSLHDGPEFHAVPFIATGVIGLLFGWLAARCLSVWLCAVCHQRDRTCSRAGSRLAVVVLFPQHRGRHCLRSHLVA